MHQSVVGLANETQGGWRWLVGRMFSHQRTQVHQSRFPCSCFFDICMLTNQLSWPIIQGIKVQEQIKIKVIFCCTAVKWRGKVEAQSKLLKPGFLSLGWQLCRGRNADQRNMCRWKIKAGQKYKQVKYNCRWNIFHLFLSLDFNSLSGHYWGECRTGS